MTTIIAFILGVAVGILFMKWGEESPIFYDEDGIDWHASHRN